MPSPDDIGALPAGTVLHDRYRVEAVLGAGAFGITYRATDTVLERSVAIKELYPEEYRLTREGTEVSVPSAKNAQHQRLIERVIKQGLLHRKLDHPHLMDVYEAFKAHNTAYLVAEHLAGESLRAWLSEAGRLPGAEVRRLIEQVGGGLAHLHARGALHLDVKPANVMHAAGEYVLIDYGAGRMDREVVSIQLSTGGYTPGYAAIEQTDGSVEKGPYTDLYALGVTAYECLTGRRYRSGKRQGRYHLVKRTWRTRKDPFEDVNEEIYEELRRQPHVAAKAIFLELLQRYPGAFTDGQLRTLQWRVKEWRLKQSTFVANEVNLRINPDNNTEGNPPLWQDLPVRQYAREK
jgi:serine/threonine protein kinase